MPFRTPEILAHPVTMLSDIIIGCGVSLSVGPRSTRVAAMGRVSFVAVLENTGVAVEITTSVNGAAWTAVVVFMGPNHPQYGLYLDSPSTPGIRMGHGYGDLVEFGHFTNTLFQNAMAPGVYEMNPGTLLVTSDRAFRARNGEVSEVIDFTNTADDKGFFHVGEEAFSTLVAAMPRTASEIDKLMENDVFAVSTPQGAHSVHRRRAHGIEPVIGERLTMANLKKSLCTVTPLTRPSRPIQIGDVYSSISYFGKVLEINGARISLLYMSRAGEGAHHRVCQTSATSTEFSNNRIAFTDSEASLCVNPESIHFPPKLTFPEQLLRSGNVIVDQGVAYIMAGLRHDGNKSTLYSYAAGSRDLKEFHLSRDGQEFSTYCRDGQVVPTVTPPGIEGALYTAPWALGSHALVFKAGMFIRVDLVQQHLLEGTPIRCRLVRFNYDALGQPRLPSDHNMQYPVLRAMPGNWSINIPMPTASPWVEVYREGDHHDQLCTWELPCSMTVQDYRCSGAGNGWDETEVDPGFRVGVPVALSQFNVEEGLPTRVLRIRNFRCEQCNQRVSMSSTQLVGLALGTSIHMCDGCRDTHAHRCSTCRGLYVAPLMDSPSSCRVCHDAGGVPLINNYSYKPSPKWHGEGPLFFGTEVELEMRSPDASRELMSSKVRGLLKDSWYAKTDGSIRHGLEFVSHPFSVKYILNKEELYRKLFGLLNEHMEARDNCGIHIHTSKDGYAVKLESIPEIGTGVKLDKKRLIQRGLLRAQKFIYGNPALTIHFAGRVSSYANLKLDKTCGNMHSIAHPRSGSGTAGVIGAAMGGTKSNRYEAMNFTDKTVEFRIFKTTTDFDEYLRNVLFVDSVIQYVRGHAMPKAGAPSTLSYRKFLEDIGSLYAPVLAHYDTWSAKPLAMAAK